MKRISVEDKAAEWFVELQSTERIEDKWLEFEKWIAESQEHDEAFTRIENAWALADKLKDAVNPARFSLGLRDERQGVCRSFIARWLVRQKWSLVGAAILTGCMLWAIRFGAPPTGAPVQNGPWTPIATGVGEHQEKTLPDGSIVELNTATALRVNMDSHRRQARLDRGEAFFKVAHDPKRPFWVEAGLSRVKAVGTEFVVFEKSEMEMTTVVTEGGVEIYGPGGAFKRVGALHAATTTARGIEVIELKPGDIERRTAWLQGELKFDGEPLKEVVMEFNRYNEQKIQIVDPSIRSRAVAGTYLATDPEGFAGMIDASIDVRHFPIPSEHGPPIIALAGKGTREKNR